MTESQDRRIAEVVASVNFGEATAVKRGRNPKWPYVPVIATTDEFGVTRTSQVLRVAYATRDEAVARAENKIAKERASLAKKLAERQYRALREHYGLPREIEND
jgi:hypothetical protein